MVNVPATQTFTEAYTNVSYLSGGIAIGVI